MAKELLNHTSLVKNAGRIRTSASKTAREGFSKAGDKAKELAQQYLRRRSGSW